jgi:hypothetical protein
MGHRKENLAGRAVGAYVFGGSPFGIKSFLLDDNEARHDYNDTGNTP